MNELAQLIVVRRDIRAVDDQELLTGRERDQGHVPWPTTIVDALVSIRDECPEVPGFNALRRRADDDDKRRRVQGHECLASQWMAFHEIEAIRQ